MAKGERIAFLGLGIMGSRMAANLCRAGFDVTVWNRTRARAERFGEDQGARVAATPAEASREAGVTITMVVDAPDVEEVLFEEGGAAEGMAGGSVCVDMSTIPPTASRRIAERLAERDVDFVDAPVTGSKPKAEDGTLTIMAGGEREAVERVRPLLEVMGELVLHVGPHGEGEMIKLINNTVAAINAAALAEALALGRKAELDVDSVLAVLRAGTGASAMLDLKAEPMLAQDFEPLFKLEHMLKDVRHCLAEAEAAGTPFSLAEAAERLYAEADSSGQGGSDFAAVGTVAQRAAGLGDEPVS